MTDPSWSEGYVVDLDYTRGYFRELSPAHLRSVLLLAGMEPPGAAQPFTYYELGCGNGYSTALHAAASPHGRFCGVDFNPTHIHHAQKLAQDTGLGNVRFLEKSFAELLEFDLEDADYIVLHGVWSWVGEEQRAQLLEFLRRRLKPGGRHEYYNANWSPFYHAEVAQALASAKLSYAGAASVLDNFDQFTLNPEVAQLVGDVGERALAETITSGATSMRAV